MGPKLMQFEAERISAEFQRMPADHAIPFMTMTLEEAKAMKRLFEAADVVVNGWGKQDFDATHNAMVELRAALAEAKK